MYLDAGVRSAISSFAKVHDLGEELARLERHLADGTWMARNERLLAREELDIGYRLLVGQSPVRRRVE